MSRGFAASAFLRIFISSTAFIFGVGVLVLGSVLVPDEVDVFLFSMALWANTWLLEDEPAAATLIVHSCCAACLCLWGNVGAYSVGGSVRTT